MVYLVQILQYVMLAAFITTSVIAAPSPTDAVDPSATDAVDPSAITAQSAGLWYNPHHDGEGFSIQVSDTPNADSLFTVTWYTYDNQRQQMWLLGTQTFNQGDTSVTVALLRPTGTRFGNNFSSEDVTKGVWGLVTFDFLSCNEATATINTSTGFGTGVIPLNKLTNNSGANCANTATIADPPFYSDAGGVPIPPPQQGLGEGVITSRGDHSVDGIRINSERLFIDNRQCFIEANLINQTNEPLAKR